jgi:hypothetical protein
MHIIVLGFIDGPHSGTYITSAFKPIEIEKNQKMIPSAIRQLCAHFLFLESRAHIKFCIIAKSLIITTVNDYI